jgi:hypothetical protein
MPVEIHVVFVCLWIKTKARRATQTHSKREKKEGKTQTKWRRSKRRFLAALGRCFCVVILASVCVCVSSSLPDIVLESTHSKTLLGRHFLLCYPLSVCFPFDCQTTEALTTKNTQYTYEAELEGAPGGEVAQKVKEEQERVV